MKNVIIILIIINLFLLGVAVAVWQLPTFVMYSHQNQDSIKTVHRVYIDTVVRVENQPQISTSKGNNILLDAKQRNDNAYDIKKISKENPFYNEAAKVLAGKLDENDAERRRVILNYCEHFRTAYTTKDIDFLRQLFSEKALIIVGNVVQMSKSDEGKGISADEKVSFSVKSKNEYLGRLEKVFEMNKKIDVRFSEFRILRHPTMEHIYGVNLKQKYSSDRYGDEGYLFLLWDFRNKSKPMIHVRTWQPSSSITNDGDVIGMKDFNLE